MSSIGAINTLEAESHMTFDNLPMFKDPDHILSDFGSYIEGPHSNVEVSQEFVPREVSCTDSDGQTYTTTVWDRVEKVKIDNASRRSRPFSDGLDDSSQGSAMSEGEISARKITVSKLFEK